MTRTRQVTLVRSLALLCVAGILSGGVTLAREEIKKINRYAVAQEQEGVSVAVSWKVALHTEGDYLPLIVNVVNNGKGTAKVGLENFKIVDEEGDTFRASSYEDVVSVYGNLGRDKRLARQLEMGGLNTRPQTLVSSSFYPYEEGTQDPTTELMTQRQMIDMLYFQIPERARHKKLTLVVDGIIDAPPYKIPFEIE